MSNLYQVPDAYLPAASRYEEMPYRKCGKSGVKMSAISLGFWHNFGGVDCYENARAIARAAFDAGINCFDLANNYGPPYGSAEENFGRMMEADFRPYRDELFITSKAGYDMWPGPYGKGGSRKYMLASLDQSLRRMKLDYVDLFYHHCMDADTPLEESMSALVTAYRSGRALYVGISNYDTETAEKAIELLHSEGVPCLVQQSRYSMLAREPLTTGLLDCLARSGVGFAAFSPLAQGLLSGKYNGGIPADSRAAGYSRSLQENQIDEARLRRIIALGKIAEQRGQTMAQLALAWLLQDARVSTVIIGASRVSQLQENIGAVRNLAFSEAELLEIDTILKGQ